MEVHNNLFEDEEDVIQEEDKLCKKRIVVGFDVD